MSLIKKNNAVFFLFLNAFLWGSSYVWSKMLLGYLPRFSILFLCSLGGLAATVALFYPALKKIRRDTVRLSVLISGFSILSNTFCMLALQYTTSSNAAFIVQTSVVITPILMTVRERKLPERKLWISAAAALAGLFLLTCRPEDFRWNIGDLFALLNAVCFSAFLTCLNIYSGRLDPVHFSMVHHATNSAAFLFLAVVLETGSLSTEGLGSLGFAALLAASMAVVALTVLIQSAAIRFIRPEKATLIYTFEPLTAALLAFLFINERLDGVKAAAGCLLIILSVAYTLYKPRIWKKHTAPGQRSCKGQRGGLVRLVSKGLQRRQTFIEE